MGVITQLLPYTPLLGLLGVLRMTWVPQKLEQLSSWSSAELLAAKQAIELELAARNSQRSGTASSIRGPLEAPRTHSGLSGFQFVHKKTYATGDPEAAALFLRDHVFAEVEIWNTSHTCADGSQSGFTHTAAFPATPQQPQGFTMHFVRNPHKAPGALGVPGVGLNASRLFRLIEDWRKGFGQANRFDQFMDNHLGIVFESLDPLVRNWQAAGVPFICRTWCCGPGMPQWPDRCTKHSFNNTRMCEMGCYVEVPHGLVLEVLCGLDGGLAAAKQCLTLVEPEVFDLCSGS